MKNLHVVLLSALIINSIGGLAVQADLSPWPHRIQQGFGVSGLIGTIATTFMREGAEKDVVSSIDALRAHADALTVNTYSPSEMYDMQLQAQRLFNNIVEGTEKTKDKWQATSWAVPVSFIVAMLFTSGAMSGDKLPAHDGPGDPSLVYKQESAIRSRTHHLRRAQWVIGILSGIAFLALATIASGKEPGVRKKIEALLEFTRELSRRDPGSITPADSAHIHDLLRAITEARSSANTFSRYSALVLLVGIACLTVMSFSMNHTFPFCRPLGEAATPGEKGSKWFPNPLSLFRGDKPQPV